MLKGYGFATNEIAAFISSFMYACRDDVYNGVFKSGRELLYLGVIQCMKFLNQRDDGR